MPRWELKVYEKGWRIEVTANLLKLLVGGRVRNQNKTPDKDIIYEFNIHWVEVYLAYSKINPFEMVNSLSFDKCIYSYIHMYVCMYMFVQPPQFKPRHMFVTETFPCSQVQSFTLFTPNPGNH